MDDDSEHKVDDSDNECVLDSEKKKMGRRRVKVGQRAMATLHYSLSKCEHFYLFFSYPTPSFLLLALILLGLGEATRSELFGTKGLPLLLHITHQSCT